MRRKGELTLYIQLHQIKKQLNYRKIHRPFETLPLGSAMKFRRKELHMTLEEAALDLTSVSYLSKLENNLIKPNMRFIKLFEERLKMKFDQHEYDHDYHDQIHHALLALHQDQMMDDSIYAQYKNKQNHQSYLFIFTHHILSNEYDKIKPYYESLKSYVPNLLDDEMTLFLTCVTKVLMKEERYLDAYEAIKLMSQVATDEVLVHSIELKHQFMCAIELMRPFEVEHIYPKYVSNLQSMHAFDQLDKAQFMYLVFQTSQLTIQAMDDILHKIPHMEELDKTYIQTLSYFHHKDYEKSRLLSKPYIEVNENWLFIYLLSLDHLNEVEEIKNQIKEKLNYSFEKLSHGIIFKHLTFKYLKDTTHLFQYLRELLINRYLLTDNYHTLSYLYKDAATLFSQHYYYKEAHQTLHQWLIEHQLLMHSI